MYVITHELIMNILDIKKELFKRTDVIFNNLKIPIAPNNLQEKYEAYCESRMWRHAADTFLEMRKFQVEQMGFEKLTDKEIVFLLKGEYYISSSIGDTQSIEYLYEPSNTFVLGCEKVTTYHGRGWKVTRGFLDYINAPIPLGVMLRINELKKMNLFNSYYIYAPSEMFNRPVPEDPIIVGSLERIFYNNENKFSESNVDSLYFIAQW